jgi:aconitase A
MSASQPTRDAFGARASLATQSGEVAIYRLDALAKALSVSFERLPFTLRVLVENALRQHDLNPDLVSQADVEALAKWRPGAKPGPGDPEELPFMPARVIMQDFTGVPAVVDLAAMRDAVKEMGGDPNGINPLVPADLVIDHSVQVDAFGSTLAFGINVEREYERNGERYALLRWAQQAFKDFSVVPPGSGIVHQVNLEYLAKVIWTRDGVAFPDTLVGTDSHTTMINGLGVLGWGVGGIEAEAVMLGQPLYLLTPEVVGVHLSGSLPEGATATDLVLVVTQMLRKHGVVGRFVEFAGTGLSSLGLADRATISNMSPEFGATATFFPVDAETLRYLRLTGRDEALVDVVERYVRAQGMFRTDETPVPEFTEMLELDLSTIEPSMAGPRRPQDRVVLGGVKDNFRTAFKERYEGDQGGRSDDEALGGAAVAVKPPVVTVVMDGKEAELTHGSVAIAAITSCTNTSNPSVMIGAGLLAKRAVERGLKVSPTVKTSLAPGSRAVTDYLEAAGLTPFLEALGFQVVGYGCTTCIAEGTPVSLANGASARIESLPKAGGARVYGPTTDGELAMAAQTKLMDQGVREVVSLVLQDGRTLVCTPDHKLLTVDGCWVRADELRLNQDRVVAGLEMPLDEPADDENGYRLSVGSYTFTMDTPLERQRMLAFARLIGHLLGDGSISALGQGRLNVGQAVDREIVLNDIELITGWRPAASRYDDRKWAIVLPKALTDAIVTLPGVRVGRRILQAPTLPAVVLDEHCPVAVVREYLGGMFGADGHAPTLKRYSQSSSDDDANLSAPSFSQSTIPTHVARLKEMMRETISLLARCGVETEGAAIYEYPTRRSSTTYAQPVDGLPHIEVRLSLPDGLSFVEHVGFRYCVDKQMRASAAAVYWRTVDNIHESRLWMSNRLTELHDQQVELSFSKARQLAAAELSLAGTVIAPHYSLLEGHDRFNRLPHPDGSKFKPLHRDSAGFPSPAQMFHEMGVRNWFAPLGPRSETGAKRYCVEKDALTLPTFSLQVVDRRPAGERHVYDLSVNDLHAFIAGSVAVHNCIGNSGPLPEEVGNAVTENDLVVAAVLSGNRNFEGRIHPQVRASYLASPPLVVAYALAGTVDVDLTHDPIGEDPNGQPVYLRDIWPNPQEVNETLTRVVKPEIFTSEYGHIFDGDERWKALPVPEAGSPLFAWDENSTYVRKPPFFEGIEAEPAARGNINGARALAAVGDSITTDHISPAGSFPASSPAGQYLTEHGVTPRDFNSYGSRRGNHEVMMRGTFANIRLRNALANGKEGYWTTFQPDGDEMTIYDASMRYQREGTPLIVLAGKEYGSGSSRDWAAKGPLLLGIRATIAESYERIHRSNLVGMGILPLQFKSGESRESLGLTGHEIFDIEGIDGELKPRQEVTVRATAADGATKTFQVIARLDSPIDITYYRNGGILQTVLRRLAKDGKQA